MLNGFLKRGLRRSVHMSTLATVLMSVMLAGTSAAAVAAQRGKAKPTVAAEPERALPRTMSSELSPVAPAAEPDAAPSATESGTAAETTAEAGDGVAPAANAAGTPDPATQPTLDTLAQVLAKVWRDNPEVLQAESALKASGYDISAARSGYFPYLQVQTSLAEQSDDSVSTLYFVLPLWSGGLTGAQVDEAKSRQQMAAAELVRVRLELGLRAVEAYVNVAQAQEQAIQWASYVGALKQLLASVQRRSKEGAAPEADVQTAIARLRQAEAGMEGNRAGLLINRAQLAQLLLARPGSVDWPSEAYMLTDAEIEAAAQRKELHPNRILAKAEVEAQEAIARAARASLWPELSLQHRRQLEGVVFDPSNDATLLVAQFQSNNGLRGYLGYRAEKQRLDATRARADAVGREIEATIEVGRTQLAATAMQLQVQAQAASASAALVDSFMRQYEAGRKTWLEVLNAQREANESLLQSIGLKRNYWYANAKLALEGMYWHRLGAQRIELPSTEKVTVDE